jgi:hypothetical protein
MREVLFPNVTPTTEKNPKVPSILIVSLAPLGSLLASRPDLYRALSATLTPRQASASTSPSRRFKTVALLQSVILVIGPIPEHCNF